MKFNKLTITTFLFVLLSIINSPIGIPTVYASPLALITRLLTKSYDDIARSGGKLTARSSKAHIVSHWSANASKHIHGVFSVSKTVIQKNVERILLNEARYIKKTDDVLSRAMSRGDEGIRLNARTSKAQTYLSKNTNTGGYDLVIEKSLNQTIGTNGERVLTIVIDEGTGLIKSIYPRKSLTQNILKPRLYSFGAPLLVLGATKDEIMVQFTDYQDTMKANCDCDGYEERAFYTELLIDVFSFIGYGSATTNTGEKEWLEWRNFLNYEFERRLQLQYEQCDQDLADVGIEASCQRLTNGEYRELYDEFHGSTSMVMSL